MPKSRSLDSGAGAYIFETPLGLVFFTTGAGAVYTEVYAGWEFRPDTEDEDAVAGVVSEPVTVEDDEVFVLLVEVLVLVVDEVLEYFEVEVEDEAEDVDEVEEATEDVDEVLDPEDEDDPDDDLDIISLSHETKRIRKTTKRTHKRLNIFNPHSQNTFSNATQDGPPPSGSTAVSFFC